MTADIIKGPWRKGRKIVIPDPNETIEIEEDLMFADNLTEQIMVQLIHTMSENGFDINNESFIRSMAFVIETLKASIYKELELESIKETKEKKRLENVRFNANMLNSNV